MKYKVGVLLLMGTCAAFGQKPGDVLIRNATVIPVTSGIVSETDILIAQGKIAQIGKQLAAPAGTQIIDATGMYVMPGIIDAHSHIAIDAVNEGTNPVTAEVAVGDAVDPYDVSIYRALAGGVTISHAMHGSANVIGGQCQTIKHRWGIEDPQAYKMKGAPRTIKFALGENPMRVHGEGRGILPRTRMGVEQVLRSTFSEAMQYKEKWSAYRKLKEPGLAAPPMYNLRLETIADIIDGKILIHCHAYRADEMLMLMNVLRDFGVNKICFQHANEGFKIAPELAAFGASTSVFADWWAYKFEVYYSTAYNASILSRNGVVTSINSDSGELIRHLYHEAAKTQKYGGLTDAEALALISINPAKHLGIDQLVGSIEVGKDGDLAIFNHHPLSIYAVAQKTIVDGIVRFDIASDPDDIRIDIDPEETIPAFYESRHEANNCMQDTEFSSEHVHH
jgi:imidazolonepropionase-like amidohydrolase